MEYIYYILRALIAIVVFMVIIRIYMEVANYIGKKLEGSYVK